MKGTMAIPMRRGGEFHEMMQKSLHGAQQAVTIIPAAGRHGHCHGRTQVLTESSQQRYKASDIILPILQMRTLRHKEMV